MLPVNWGSRRVFIVGISIVVIACFILLIFSLLPKKQTAETQTHPSTAQKTIERESARVYIKNLYAYKDSIDADNRSKIETTFYNYAYIIGGVDLYTGTIRNGSFGKNNLPDGGYDAHMLIDVDPINVTYKISIAKNKVTDNRQIFFITCASKAEQKNKDAICKDEGAENR